MEYKPGRGNRMREYGQAQHKQNKHKNNKLIFLLFYSMEYYPFSSLITSKTGYYYSSLTQNHHPKTPHLPKKVNDNLHYFFPPLSTRKLKNTKHQEKYKIVLLWCFKCVSFKLGVNIPFSYHGLQILRLGSYIKLNRFLFTAVWGYVILYSRIQNNTTLITLWHVYLFHLSVVPFIALLFQWDKHLVWNTMQFAS